MGSEFYEICEILMLLCFGLSWPMNAIKSYKARTAKGKSLPFLIMIIVGYLCGITGKLLNPAGFHWYVMFFYLLNLGFVSVDFVLYFRNRHLDHLHDLEMAQHAPVQQPRVRAARTA